jgi:hypothetical protein
MQRDNEAAGSGRPHGSYNPHSGDPAAPINPRLLDVMRAVALNDSRETREALYRELTAATFVLPVAEPPPGQVPGLLPYAEGDPFTALAERDLNGRLALPVFTDTSALFAWAPPEASYVAMRAPALFNLALDVKADIVVINVAGPTGGEINRSEVQVLAQGGMPGADGTYAFPEGARAMIRLPEPPPAQALLDVLWRAAAAQASVDSAYLVEIVIGQGPPHLLAGIEFDPLPEPEALDTAMRAMVDAVNEMAEPGNYIDFMVLVPGEQMAAQVKELGLPVYRRLFASGRGR